MPDPALIGPVSAPDLHVMTFNIRRRMPHVGVRSPDLWATRAPLIARLLQAEQPALLGVQEALHAQAQFLLTTLGTRYRGIGHGRRTDGTGEGCPIFFDTDRLELLDWTQTALSDKPDKPGSATWGNMTPRIVVAAILRDRATGREFRSINTHLDNLSRRARMRSADAIRSIVTSSSLPDVLTGDFNTGEWTGPYVELTRDGALRDTWAAARRRLTPEWGTFPNYKDARYDRKRIDWILASPAIEVEKVGINVTKVDGGWPSDHAPVQAVIRIGDPAD